MHSDLARCHSRGPGSKASGSILSSGTTRLQLDTARAPLCIPAIKYHMDFTAAQSYFYHPASSRYRRLLGCEATHQLARDRQCFQPLGGGYNAVVSEVAQNLLELRQYDGSFSCEISSEEVRGSFGSFARIKSCDVRLLGQDLKMSCSLRSGARILQSKYSMRDQRALWSPPNGTARRTEGKLGTQDQPCTRNQQIHSGGE